jgi:hypothetical protein
MDFNKSILTLVINLDGSDARLSSMQTELSNAGMT